jgi:hypothetical protein
MEASNPGEKPDLKPGRYRHFKGGEYEVIAMARDTEIDEWRVLYRSLNQEAEVVLWDRPYSIFVAHVAYEGEYVPRFEYIDKM